ncbi:MAG: LysM peptidoglycan-binding domain-containing protein, partial [Nitrospinales bacterium]
HPKTMERIINADMKASSLLRRKSNLKDNRKVFLAHLRGLTYGGKKDRHDSRRYKPQYIDIYTVRSGDTFESIAERELGDKTRAIEIATLNGKREFDSILPGELLKIVKTGTYPGDKSLRIQPELP